MDLRQGAHRALGPLRPARSAAEIRRLGVSDHLVVGRRQGGEGGIALVIEPVAPRRVLGIGAGAIASGAVGLDAAGAAGEDAERHGMSAFGDLKYPAGFPHFDYVDPEAPKGGMFSQIGPGTIYNQNFLTFNSLNSYILKGDAAQGMELTFATLMARAERRAGCDVWARRARGAHLRRRADLSLPAAAGGALPRRQPRSPRTTSPSR